MSCSCPLFTSKSRHRLAQYAAARSFAIATSNRFHSLLSPTTRRSILLIRSERSASAALIAAMVCCKVLTFDPSDTIPPRTTAIDPIAATWLDPNKSRIIKSGNATPPAIATLETNIIFRHRSEALASSSSCASIREISSIGLSSCVRSRSISGRLTVVGGSRLHARRFAH